MKVQCMPCKVSRQHHAPLLPRVVVLCWVLAIMGRPPASWSAEYLRAEEPAPDSVKELSNPFNAAFRPRLRRPLPALGVMLKQKLAPFSPFWRDTTLDLHHRTYYFHRKNCDDSRTNGLRTGLTLRPFTEPVLSEAEGFRVTRPASQSPVVQSKYPNGCWGARRASASPDLHGIRCTFKRGKNGSFRV